jgi:hypothetical protein
MPGWTVSSLGAVVTLRELPACRPGTIRTDSLKRGGRGGISLMAVQAICLQAAPMLDRSGWSACTGACLSARAAAHLWCPANPPHQAHRAASNVQLHNACCGWQSTAAAAAAAAAACDGPAHAEGPRAAQWAQQASFPRAAGGTLQRAANARRATR